MSRRQLLRWSALVAATPLLSALPDPERAYAAGRAGSSASGSAVAMNLELVTLTETSAVLTWYTGDPSSSDEFGRLAPAPADTEVLVGTSPAAMRLVHSDATATPYHYVELTGLEPGQTYFYVARSNGQPAVPSVFAPGNVAGSSVASTSSGGPFAFTTPQPPPGRYLFSLVLCNDLHLGESTAGLITTQAGQSVPPGFQQVAGEPPYAEVMARALVADARGRGAHRLLAAGDVTSEARPSEAAKAKSILDGFGGYGTDYLVTRGNHDRSHSGTAYDGCSADPRGADLHDCFRDAFFPGDGPTWFAADAFGLRVLGLDTYDKTGNGGDNGALSTEQLAWLTAQLTDEPDRPTLVFGHHPVSQESSLTTAEPVVFDLDPQQAVQLEQLYAAASGVFLHHSGHTHRNRRTTAPNAPGVVFQEVCATKEYPGGFSLVRVHSGGYAMNFYKTRDDLAREWSERTRQEDFGGYPYYTFGTVGDRNVVVQRDFSGLRAAGSPDPSVPEVPAAAALPVAGALALGAAALARRVR